jgi:hypothetical protein
MAIPLVTSGLDRARARAAARYLAAQLALVRTQAVSRSTTMAMRFQQTATGVSIAVYEDGNANGVRTREIESGVDRPLDAPVRLEDLFPGVLIAVTDTYDGAAVDLGGSDLMSFSPAGTATSGTISVRGRDGSQFGVRVFGVTGRVRLLRFDPTLRQWTETF